MKKIWKKKAPLKICVVLSYTELYLVEKILINQLDLVHSKYKSGPEILSCALYEKKKKNENTFLLCDLCVHLMGRISFFLHTSTKWADVSRAFSTFFKLLCCPLLQKMCECKTEPKRPVWIYRIWYKDEKMSLIWLDYKFPLIYFKIG